MNSSHIAGVDRQGSGKLLTLEAGRFLAALFVMLFHYSAVVGEAYGRVLLDDILRPGHVGVPYFFVLSGFIIYHVHRNDLARPNRLANFAWRRAVRLYPMFWIISLVMLAGFIAIPSLAGERTITPAGLIADFLLLPHADAILSISWTLRHEMIFYLLFALAIWKGARAFWLVAIWIAASLAAAIIAPTDRLGLVSLLSSPLNLGFGLGLLCAGYGQSIALRRPGLWVGLGAFALACLCLLEWRLGQGVPHVVVVLGVAGDVGYLVASAILIFGLVQLERGWRMPLPRLWQVLGGSSYVLYLLHQPAASLLLRIVPALRMMPAEAALAILALVAAVLSVGVHLIVERPLQRLMNHRSPVRAVPAAGAVG